tara:strand:- start:679 stop:2478 length:1800 start_codon:yes stop_codon:yes gene_type:complete
MSYFMLIISILYLLLEIAFRAFAVDKMGSLNLLQSEIQYLEILGRFLAAFGFSLFFINLHKNIFVFKKVLLFSVYFVCFFFAQKMIFDNIHVFADKKLEENAYYLNIYKNAVFTDDKLSADLPYLIKNKDDIKFKTFFGMLPYLYSSTDKVKAYVEDNEEYFINKIVNYKNSANAELENKAFNNFRKSTIVPLYQIYEKNSQFQYDSELHQAFVKFHFSAFGYYFYLKNKKAFPEYSGDALDIGYKAYKTGMARKLYNDLSDDEKYTVQSSIYKRLYILTKSNEIDLSSFPEGDDYVNKTFFPSPDDFKYRRMNKREVFQYMKKRYNYEKRIEKAIKEYGQILFNKNEITSSEYNALFEIVTTGKFDLFYNNSVITKALKEAYKEDDANFLTNKDFLKLVFGKFQDRFYITEKEYVKYFQNFFKKEKYEKIKSLKGDNEAAVKAVLVPPVVILFSTVAIFLNLISIIFNFLKKINVVNKYRFFILPFLIVGIFFYPFNSFSLNEREKVYYEKVVPKLKVPEYKILVTKWVVNTNDFLNGKLNSFEEIASFMFSKWQYDYKIYLKEGSLEYILLSENVYNKRDDIIKKYPEYGIEIVNFF